MSVVSTMFLQHDVKIHFFWKLVLRRYDVVSALLRMSNVEYSLLRDKISTAFPQSCKKKINNGMIFSGMQRRQYCDIKFRSSFLSHILNVSKFAIERLRKIKNDERSLTI